MNIAVKPAEAQDAQTIPLEKINPADPRRFQQDTLWP